MGSITRDDNPNPVDFPGERGRNNSASRPTRVGVNSSFVMRVHHLNCATMCPYGAWLFGQPERGLGPTRLTCHCLLVETGDGLVLVDTGLGTADVTAPRRRLSGFFRALMRPRLDLAETAHAQLARLGVTPGDVRHIVLTHLDFDHAGGLSDFPAATVHVLEDELAAARGRHGLIARGRYRPQQWSMETRWQTYEPGGETWLGFDAVRPLAGLPPEIALVPLVGHTHGHCGVAVDTGAGWLLHCGDAYFHHDEMKPVRRCPIGLRAYQTMMEVDRRARLHNQQRLRELANTRKGEVRVICAHDPDELDACTAAA
jgi:glyoxylase-like metal-dependent hydrolase (beta-lactamase superfamily II)